MDAGASVAAFIGLVGLVAQSTTSLIQLIKDIRDTPGIHQSNLKWLEQLSCVLKDLQNTGSILRKANLIIDLSTMEQYLRDCREAIDILRAHLEKSLNGLKSAGFEKRKATLKAYFGSRSADCQIQNIRRAMESLSLCHSSIIGQIVVQSQRSIQELTAQTNDLTLLTQDIRRAEESIATDIAGLRSLADRMTTIYRQDTQQLQHANLGTLQSVQNLQASHEWMAAVQGVLPLEIHSLVRNVIAEELRSASHDQQTPSNEAPRKQTLSLNPSIQNVLPLERPGTLPSSHRLDNTSDRQSWEQFEEMEKDFLLPYQNRFENYTTSWSNGQEQCPYIKSKILMFSWYYRAFFGYISVVVFERHQVTAGREENVIHVEVKIFPWRWVSSRGFQARILYDRTHGLSSPTNIQLTFPRIIRLDFPLYRRDSTDGGLWWLFENGKSDLIIDNIKSGVYHPNDLLEGTGDLEYLLWTVGWDSKDPMSLLTVASFFGDLKVVRFLLQQGARVDQSGSSDSMGWPKQKDLHGALTAQAWRIVLGKASPSAGDIAREERLDTARLLISAGSDIDAISFPALLIWAIEWDLETFLSVVGNHDKFHWDVIQMGRHHWDWFPVYKYLENCSADQAQLWFDKFVELCKRLKIDLSFTQPNGLTSLHWMIQEPSDKHISHLKCFLRLVISNGVDPCAVCNGYLTPTLVAFLGNRLDLWFTVLRQSGISVETVAAHTLGLITGSTVQDIISRESPDPDNYDGSFSIFSILSLWVGQCKWSSIFDVTKQLRADLIEAFERQGCYLNESGDRGNMVTYKASSSVDFKPSTVYDAERAKRDLRRRTEAQKHPQ